MFYKKKCLEKALNWNKPNKSLSKKDKNSNKNPEKRKHKDGKAFVRSTVIIYPKINITIITKHNFSACKLLSTTFLIALFTYKNSGYFDTNKANHLCNTCNTFTSYTEFYIL